MNVDVQIAADVAGIPATASIRKWVEHTVHAASPGEDFEVSVRIVDEVEMQGLNHEFRGKDRTTNVLSFPAGPARRPSASPGSR